jgi:hypothetical protein
VIDFGDSSSVNKGGTVRSSAFLQLKEAKMIGAIAGDMIGSPYESCPIKYHCEF